MYNIKRPSSKETEEDLIGFDEILRKQIAEGEKEAIKNEEDKCVQTCEITKRKSAFTASKQRKKKKESIVDYSVYEEAIHAKEKMSAVIGKIVERDVTWPPPDVKNWHALSTKTGFPEVPTLTILDRPEQVWKSSGKSLYMQQLEMEGKAKWQKCTSESKTRSEPPSQGILAHSLRGNLDEEGDTSKFELSVEEADTIHRENVSLLSSMSEKEIIEARNQLLRNHKPESIQFIKSLRTNQAEVGTKGCSSAPGTSDSMDVEEDTGQKTGVAKEDQNISLSNLSLPVDELQPLMDCRLEYKKFKWMTEVPKPKPLKNGEGYTARFNFEGDLLPYDTDISMQEGLHHHGEEPGRAGYTIDELFILVRSSFVQQRHIGLKVIANILRNAKEGLYDKCFDQPVMQLMVDAGVVILLRFAIDETTALVYQEGLRAMYYLVCSEPDEQCLALVSCWSPHSTVPGVSSRSHSTKKEREELDSEEKELKDVEILRLDIIRALIRMDAHLRMRYFLQTVRPAPPDVIHIFGILGRMARHSLDVAWSVAQCHGLLEDVVTHFMPQNLGSLMTGSNSFNVQSVYGFPLRHAVAFLKVMCDRGRHLATSISRLPNIMNSLLAYVSVDPTNIEMPQTEVMQLAVQSYSLWATLLSYGLKRPQEAFSSFYPMFIKQLVFYRDKVDVDDGDGNKFNYDVGAKMADVLTKGLQIASKYSLMNHHQANSKPLVTGSDGKPEVLPPPVLRWEQFGQILKLVEACLLKWFSQLSVSPCSFELSRMVGSFLNFVTAYMENWRNQDDFQGSSMISESTHAFQMVRPYLQSENFICLLKRAKHYSVLCSNLTSGECRDPHNLSSLGSVTRGGEVMPLLQTRSPFALLLPLTSFILVLVRHNHSVDDGTLDKLLDNEIIIDYLTSINNSTSDLSTNWFARIEIFTLCNFLQLVVRKDKYSKLLHETAVCLLPLIQKGDEHLIKSLVLEVICHDSFVNEFLSIESRVETLQLKSQPLLPSPGKSNEKSASLIDEISKESLQSSGNVIVDSFLRGKAIENSSAKKCGIFFLISSLTQDFTDTSRALDGYWSLQCLRNLSNEEKDDLSLPKANLIPSVRKLLSLTYLLLKNRKESLYRYTNVTGWFRYISLVFTAANDLFLDRRISQVTQACLEEILKDEGFAKIQPTVPLSGMPLCFDWYRNFMDQFSGVSYYDSTFALFAIVPQQMAWPETYRILFWDDFMPSLRFVTLTCAQMEQFIPVKQFLEPVETDERVINCYHRAIQGGFIDTKRTPFLYYVAYSHIKFQQSRT